MRISRVGWGYGAHRSARSGSILSVSGQEDAVGWAIRTRLSPARDVEPKSSTSAHSPAPSRCPSSMISPDNGITIDGACAIAGRGADVLLCQ